MAEASIYDALGGEGEVVERIEALPWQAVESSNVLRVAWCERSAVPQRGRGKGFALGWLWVQFRSGKIYAYQDVPHATYVALKGAESVGRAHIALIRGHYSYCAFDPQTGQTFSAA